MTNLVKPTSSTRYSGLICALMLLGTLSGRVSAQAQEKEKVRPSEPVAWVRNWAVLGDLAAKETYTLVYAFEKAKPGTEPRTVFTGLKGCRRSGYGAGYFKIPVGRCQFTLLRDGANPVTVAEVSEKFDKDTGYTLLSVLNNGVPTLRLVKEYPTPPEQDGLFIYNLLTESPLQFQMAARAPQLVPTFAAQPFFLSAAQMTAGQATLAYSSKEAGVARRDVDYSGGRLSVVFMRNDYSQPSAFFYPARPPIK